MPAASSIRCRRASFHASPTKMPARNGRSRRSHAELLGPLDQRQEVARRAADRRDAEILEQGDVAAGVAAGDREDGHAQGLGAVVQAQGVGEQIVAAGVLEDVALLDAAAGQAADHDLGPDFQVAAGVGEDDRLSALSPQRCGSVGGCRPRDLLRRYGEHARGVGVAEVGLGGQRQLAEVVDAVDVGRRQAVLLHALAKHRHVLERLADDAPQPLRLQPAEQLARHEIGAAGRMERRRIGNGDGGGIHRGLSCLRGVARGRRGLLASAGGTSSASDRHYGVKPPGPQRAAQVPPRLFATSSRPT